MNKKLQLTRSVRNWDSTIDVDPILWTETRPLIGIVCCCRLKGTTSTTRPVSTPDGKKYYNADAIQHIVDELGFGWVVEQLDKSDKVLANFLGHLLSHVHPILPQAERGYKPEVGGKINLKVTHDPATGRQNSAFDFEATHSVEGETRLMVTYKKHFDWDQAVVNLFKKKR